MREPATVLEELLSPDEAPTDKRSTMPVLVQSVVAPVLGALAGLLLGAILVSLAGADPLAAYRTMAEGAFGGARQLTETILKATPLILMGSGLMVAFRSRAWNIGGEGQYFMGALAGFLVGLGLQDRLPGVVLIPIILLAGAAGGAVWAGLAALLKVKRGINEIVTTLMLNYIARFLVLYLARGPLKDPGSYLPQSSQLVGGARMPTMVGTRLHVGIVIAMLFLPITYILLWKTPLGFRLRAIGSNQDVARYAGMSVSFGVVFSLLFSGALAGLSGIIEISALHSRLKDGISGNYGFTGILGALLGRLHPAGVLIAAVFFAALTIGAQSMHSVYGLPIALAQVIHALVVLFVLAADALARRVRR
jgi:ABC-type uncharacterized transport system permease subunit